MLLLFLQIDKGLISFEVCQPNSGMMSYGEDLYKQLKIYKYNKTITNHLVKLLPEQEIFSKLVGSV